MSTALERAGRAVRRERIERVLDADDFLEPQQRREPAPWLDRLTMLAEGSYRHQGGADAEYIQETERLLGVTDSRNQHGIHVAPQELGLGLGYSTRALLAGTTTQGGYLVDSPNLSYVPALQPATSIVDLVDQRPLPFGGNISIPSSTAPLALAFQSTETTQTADSTSTTGQIAGSPHTGFLTVTFSRLLGLQSTPAVNTWLWLELRNALRVGVSNVILNGAGSNGQPHGIIGLTGVGTSSGATIAWSTIVTAEQTVAAANAIIDPTRLAFVAPPATAGLMMNRFSSPKVQPLWEGDLATGRVGGVQAFSTSSMPSATLLFGDFSTVLLPIWGGVELLVDPFQGPSGSNFKTAQITVRIMITFDVMVRHGASFYTLTVVS
ncbi:MAG: phage major capsid protein [Steroidobacteraceae bacterium]